MTAWMFQIFIATSQDYFVNQLLVLNLMNLAISSSTSSVEVSVEIDILNIKLRHC